MGLCSPGFLARAFLPEARTLRWPVPPGDHVVDRAAWGRRARSWHAGLPSGDAAVRLAGFSPRLDGRDAMTVFILG